MKKYEEILASLRAAQREHHEATETKPAPKVRGIADRIKDLQRRLSDVASEGANACPNCKQPPHGMRRTEATRRSSEIWEIGCLTCPPKDGKRFCAQGFSREHVIQKWNAGEFEPA